MNIDKLRQQVWQQNESSNNQLRDLKLEEVTKAKDDTDCQEKLYLDQDEKMNSELSTKLRDQKYETKLAEQQKDNKRSKLFDC